MRRTTPDSLVFTGTLDHDDYSFYSVAVSAAGINSDVSFSGYVDIFQRFGKALVDFPIDTQGEVCFQEGEDTGSGPDYLLLKAYYIDRAGHAALQIVMDNKASPPMERRVAFSLPVEVASLVELGRKLLNWQIQVGAANSVEWQPVVS